VWNLTLTMFVFRGSHTMANANKRSVEERLSNRYHLDIYKSFHNTKLMAKNAHQIAFRYRETDSPTGVTRETTRRLALALGVDETQAIHLALRELCNRTIPQYEADDGPVSPKVIRALEKLAGPAPTTKARSDLFPDASESS